MNKEQAQSEVDKIQSLIYKAEKVKEDEIKSLKAEKCAPLIEQARKLENEIQVAMYEKHNTKLSSLRADLLEKKKVVNALQIQDSNTLWYPHGTKVWLWEDKASRYSSNVDYQKTNKTGVVIIYDGTQDLSSLSKYDYPKIGDIVVIENKKDGSLGLKYERISEYGKLKSWTRKWYSENDTHANNILTRKENNHSS